MKRVMIVGQPGSGKSTLARQIGEVMNLPVVHMDMIHWMSGWEERAKPDKIALAQAVEDQDQWVFEGGLSATYDTRLARADMLICLDFGLMLRAWRVFRRTIRHYGRTRPDLPEGCPERFNAEFWQYIWRTRTTGRLQGMRLVQKARALGKTVFVLDSRRSVDAFLSSLEHRAKLGQSVGS